MNVNKVLRNAGFGGDKFGELARSAVSYVARFPDTTEDELVQWATVRDVRNEMARPGMKKEAGTVTFFPPKDGAFEAGALEQMYTVAKLPVFKRGAMMPDGHQGYAMPIGGVADLVNAISPNLVGVDIGCGMTVTFFWMRDEYREIVEDALQHIGRFGFNVCESPQDHPVLHDPLWQTNPVLRGLHEKAKAQFGSSGGGNHFCSNMRVSQDKLQDGIASGVYALVLHSGSRGTGAKVAKYYGDLAKKVCPAKVPTGYEYLPFDSDEGQEYFAAMNLMARYAQANHAQIIGRFFLVAREFIMQNMVHSVPGLEDAFTQRQKVTVNVYGKEEWFTFDTIQNFHNLAWQMEPEEGQIIVRHRKGSTPASAGSFGIVPGSCGTPSYITRGKGHTLALESSPHGAGRARSRTATAGMHDPDAFKAWMDEHDIHHCGIAPDETPWAYKDIEAVAAGGAELFDLVIKLTPVFSMMDAGIADDGG